MRILSDETKQFIYRLFFTRDDDLDLLQLMFLILVIYFMFIFTVVTVNEFQVPDKAWNVFIVIFITLAIAGTPKWVAKLLSSKVGSIKEILGSHVGDFKEHVDEFEELKDIVHSGETAPTPTPPAAEIG